MDNCQLAVENAGKVALGLLGPIGRTHNPGPLLREALAEARFPAALSQQVARIAVCTELLGPDVHARSDYGDEASGLTPWLFGEEDARHAMAIAEEAVDLATHLMA